MTLPSESSSKSTASLVASSGGTTVNDVTMAAEGDSEKAEEKTWGILNNIKWKNHIALISQINPLHSETTVDASKKLYGNPEMPAKLIFGL